MASGKRDRMSAAACTRAVLGALDDHDLTAVVSTVLTTKSGYWAVTTVKPTNASSREVGAAFDLSHRLPRSGFKVSGSLVGNTVKLWWKE